MTLLAGVLPLADKAKLSTASPSSELDASESVQRMAKIAPGAMLRPVMVPDKTEKTLFPSFAPVLAMSGVRKLSAATLVQAPVSRSPSLAPT